MRPFVVTPDVALSEEIVVRIDTAQESVRVFMFWFDHQEFAEALVRAERRGLDVRVVVDRRSLLADDRNEAVPVFLAVSGVPVYLYHGRDHLLHHKLLLIDGRRLVVSSYNWRTRDLATNLDSHVELDDPALCRDVEAWMDRWLAVAAGALPADLRAGGRFEFAAFSGGESINVPGESITRRRDRWVRSMRSLGIIPVLILEFLLLLILTTMLLFLWR